jgi:hypothetical protein
MLDEVQESVDAIRPGGIEYALLSNAGQRIKGLRTFSRELL